MCRFRYEGSFRTKNFLHFHEKLAAGNVVDNGVCQCLRVTSSRANLAKHNVTIEEVSSNCDCGKAFNLPVPLDQVFQEKEVDLTHLLEIEVLDYVHQSTNSCPSPH